MLDTLTALELSPHIKNQLDILLQHRDLNLVPRMHFGDLFYKNKLGWLLLWLIKLIKVIIQTVISISLKKKMKLII